MTGDTGKSPMALGRSLFKKTVPARDAADLVQVILEFGGTVISIVAVRGKREVWAAFGSENTAIVHFSDIFDRVEQEYTERVS